MKKFLSTVMAALLPIAAVTAMEASPASAAGAFTCSSTLYQTSTTPKGISSFGTDPTNSATYQKFTQMGGNFATAVNAAGYNPLDNYIYGIAGGKLAKIDNAGTMTLPYATAPSGTGTVGSSGGDFLPYDGSGHAYLLTASGDSWSRIDVTTNTYITYTNSGSTPWASLDLTIMSDGVTAYDVNAGVLQVATINNTNHTFSVVNRTITYPNTIGSGDSFGAAFHDAAGDLFFFDNTSKYMYYMPASQLSAPTPALTQFGAQSVLTSPNDGAACGNASSPLAPTVTTGAASSITNTGATVAGAIVPANSTVPANGQQICFSTSNTVTNGLLSSSPTCIPATGAALLAVSNTTTNISSPLTGLSAGTKYYYQAQATGSNGMVGFGAVLYFTTTGGSSPIAPNATTATTPSVLGNTSATIGGTVETGAPTGSEITATAPSAIVVIWSASPSVNGSGELNSGATTVTATPSTLAAGTAATQVSISVTGLTAGTTYYYQVKATNITGQTDWGTVESFTTTGGVVTSAPTVTTTQPATSVTTTAATLGGTVTTGANTGEAIDAGNINICYSTTNATTGGQLSNNPVCLDATPSSAALSATNLAVALALTGLTPGTTYYYQANASNQVGQLGYGTVESFTTTALPTYNVTWNANNGSGNTTSSGVTTVTTPTPTKSGYTFAGWTCTPPGSPANNVSAGVTFTPTANTTCEAGWTAIQVAPPAPPTYTVAFVNQGSTVASTTNVAGTVITCPAAPTRAGYIFQGWSACAAGGTYTITGAATITAIWVEELAAQPNATGGQNAHKDEPVTLLVNAALTGQQYVDPTVGIKLTLTPNEADKTQAPLNSDNQVVFKDGRLAHVTGSGLRPNTDVQVYISKSAMAGLTALPVAPAGIGHVKAITFADPLLLGTLKTDANGNFADWLPIPAGLEVGSHVLQVDGYAPDWSLHSANFPVLYAVPHTYSKSLTVYFTPDSAKFTAATTKAVADLIALLPKDGQSFTVDSKGFVFPIDSHTANIRISSARAKAIALALKNGIKALGQQATVDHVGLGRINVAKQTSRRVEATVSWTVFETQG